VKEHLIDEKYNGQLKGVGSDKIMGRIHYIELQLECGIYACGFTVCSNNEIGAILGIDMMRNLGIILDFTKNKLSFENGKYELPFE
jgi:DNA damage-inducible protein 1